MRGNRDTITTFSDFFDEKGNFGMDKNERNANLAALNDCFDLEVETMFNPSPKPMSKAEFLNLQDEKNWMFPYGDAFLYDSETERLCGEIIDDYFNACLAKIKQAEESTREL